MVLQASLGTGPSWAKKRPSGLGRSQTPCATSKGTSQSWRGSGPSHAWPSPSKCATRTKADLTDPHWTGPQVCHMHSGEPRAWVWLSQTWAGVKFQSPHHLPNQAPLALSQVGLGPVSRLACKPILPGHCSTIFWWEYQVYIATWPCRFGLVMTLFKMSDWSKSN
jgi:hypothetical protein